MNKYQKLKKLVGSLNVLYINKNQSIPSDTFSILEKFFSNINVTENGKKGIEAFEAYYQKNGKYYDIVIIETKMPEFNGIDISTLILAQNDEQNILIISENTDLLLNLRELGIFSFIPKPIDENYFESNIMMLASIIQKQEILEKQSDEIEMIEKNLKTAGEEAKEASRQKSYFLANMSHEIRTPLNAIMGFITLLSEKENDKEKLKYLKVIKDASDSLLKVINDILDITKIESGKLEIDHVPFSPYEKLIHTVELFQAKAAQKGVVFKTNISHSLPETLIGDPFRIQQIFANLLSNAIKFTPEGSMVKAVIWYSDEILHITVKDYGIGIIKEKHQYIFEAFRQADNRMAVEYGGTGLGLALCAELSKLMKGGLSFRDNPKGGSVFILKVKAPIAKKAVSEPSKEKNLSEKELLTGHVLIVDDIESNRIFASIILSNMGLTFDMAVDGFDAIEKFKTHKYDIILMDENMPRLNGIAAAKKILKLEEEQNLKHTPIITLTANAIKGDKERYLEAGVDYYLSKPVHPNDIYSVLMKFLPSLS